MIFFIWFELELELNFELEYIHTLLQKQILLVNNTKKIMLIFIEWDTSIFSDPQYFDGHIAVIGTPGAISNIRSELQPNAAMDCFCYHS